MRRMGRLLGLRMDAARGNVPEVALPLELLLLAPDAADHVERLVPDGAGVARVDLEALLLVGVAPARAEVDASAGHMVGHGDLLGDADRMLVRQDDDAEAEADTLGGGCKGPDDYLRRGRSGKGREEVVLDEPDIVEADPVGQDALLDGLFNQRLLVHDPVGRWPLHLVDDPKIHPYTPRASWCASYESVKGVSTATGGRNSPQRARRAQRGGAA